MLSERITRVLTAFVDGELSPRQQAIVRKLVRQSPEARKLLEELRQDASRLRQLPRQPGSPDLAANVLQRLARPPIVISASNAAPPTSRRRPALWVATAAGLVLAVCFGWRAWFSKPTNSEELVASTRPQPEVRLPNPGERPHEPAHPTTPTPERVVRVPFVGPVLPGPEERSPRVHDKQPGAHQDLAHVLMGPPAPEPRDEKVFAAPTQEMEEFREVPILGLGLVLGFRELSSPAAQRRLVDELHKADAFRIDIRCLQAAVAIDRLQTAFAARGIGFVSDERTQARRQFPGSETNYAIYFENATAEDLGAILQILHAEDRKLEAKRKGSAQFDSLALRELTPADHDGLTKILGIEVRPVEPRRVKSLPGLDPRRPLSQRTAEQVEQSLKGQGPPRPMPGRPMVRPPDRQALLVAYNPVRPRPASAEVKRFLDNRKERSAGTLQVLLVLRGTKK